MCDGIRRYDDTTIRRYDDRSFFGEIGKIDHFLVNTLDFSAGTGTPGVCLAAAAGEAAVN